ncbi:2,3-diaminopropionate biosynthesis protein SbnB [Streptomyces sp. 2A115]|uniref:2,3-diaminopropionate biosynthesis protein SbnB n=1 Tax=Streptomyces sp. 2A115 TaxID=3457439 RepID=UPI003FD1FAC6
MPTPEFAVIAGETVHGILAGQEAEVLEVVRGAYLAHGDGQSVNPPSYFLRYPDRPADRIIALPASLGGGFDVDGVKWISSFPGNVAAGIPRASAVLILNDHETGYPFACLESSIISAARTAASAALAAAELHRDRPRPRTITFFGTGLIARYIHTYLRGTGWDFDEITVYDHHREYADAFAGYLDGHDKANVVVAEGPEPAVRAAGLIVFATTAGAPHVHEPGWFAHNPTVLHVSLRDLDPAILRGAVNVLDDVEHCLKANTSPHLLEQADGNRDFVDATLCDVLRGFEPDRGKPIVFSPFGLGVLDLAIGAHVYRRAVDRGLASPVPGFFHDLDRYR